MVIQKLRLQRGWSQQQLAELSGLSVRTIQRIEQGQAPSTESLKSLASVFEIDFATLREPEMIESTAPRTATEEALAFRRVRAIKGFYIHAVQYVIVIAALTAFNLWRSPDRIWVGWVAAGWGLGLLLHALRTFDLIPFFTASWEKKEVEKYLGRKL